jgi:hypothetical protein
MVQNAQGARITKGASRSSDAFSLPTIVHFLLSQSGTRFPSAWQTPPRQLPNADSLSRAPRSACRLICRIPHRRGGEKEGSFQLDCFRPNHEHPVKSTGRDEEAQFRLCRRTALRDRRAFCITGSIVRKLRTIDGEERWAAQHGQYSLWMTLQRFVNRYRACSPRGLSAARIRVGRGFSGSTTNRPPRLPIARYFPTGAQWDPVAAGIGQVPECRPDCFLDGAG